MNFNPVNPKSDQHLISLYNMYPESHIKVEEMVIREGTFAKQILLVSSLEMYKDGEQRAL